LKLKGRLNRLVRANPIKFQVLKEIKKKLIIRAKTKVHKIDIRRIFQNGRSSSSSYALLSP
jgi:hypothetical protein